MTQPLKIKLGKAYKDARGRNLEIREVVTDAHWTFEYFVAFYGNQPWARYNESGEPVFPPQLYNFRFDWPRLVEEVKPPAPPPVSWEEANEALEAIDSFVQMKTTSKEAYDDLALLWRFMKERR